MAKLWGGRFSKKEMDSRILKFTSSLDVDKVLARYDCLSSKVHVEMLFKCGFLTGKDKKDLVKVLDEILEKVEKSTACFEKAEDIHSAIQSYVEEKVPEAAKKMHTARSRNEQVVNDVRLYCLDRIKDVKALVRGLQSGLVGLADGSINVIIPGYTHLNRAQPVLFSHLLMAYVEMFERDFSRLEDAYKRCDVSVMGSGALAGSALPLDRKFIAEKLGFSKISANSIDAVSDRDFMAEVVGALCFIAVHLSRMAEDLILFSIPEFGFVEIGEEYCTGSSLMPQKKNPDVLELIRGKAAGVISSLNSIFVLMKGLPHSYNRDLQEDKKPLFETMDVVSEALGLMTGVVAALKPNRENAEKAFEDEFLFATDIAEYLVRKGVPFREAHDIVGKLIRRCIDDKLNISDLSISELKVFSKFIGEDVFDLLNPETSVGNKKTYGSTNPAEVKKQINNWKKILKKG